MDCASFPPTVSDFFFSPAAYLCEGSGCGAGDDAEAHESKCTLKY